MAEAAYTPRLRAEYDAKIRALLPGYEIILLRRPYRKLFVFAELGYSLYTIDIIRSSNYVAFPPGYLKANLDKMPERFKSAYSRRQKDENKK